MENISKLVLILLSAIGFQILCLVKKFEADTVIAYYNENTTAIYCKISKQYRAFDFDEDDNVCIESFLNEANFKFNCLKKLFKEQSKQKSDSFLQWQQEGHVKGV